MASDALIEDNVALSGHDVLDMSPDELAAEVERQLLELPDGESTDDDCCSESLAADPKGFETGVDWVADTACNSHLQAAPTKTAIGEKVQEDQGNRSAWAALMQSVAVNSKEISRYEEQLRSVQKLVAGDVDPDESLTDDEVGELDLEQVDVARLLQIQPDDTVGGECHHIKICHLHALAACLAL